MRFKQSGMYLRRGWIWGGGCVLEVTGSWRRVGPGGGVSGVPCNVLLLFTDMYGLLRGVV